MAVTQANIVSGISSFSIDPAGGRAFTDVGGIFEGTTIEFSSEQEKVYVEQDTLPVKHLLKLEGALLKAVLAEATFTNYKNVMAYADTSVSYTAQMGPVSSGVPVSALTVFSAKIVTSGPAATTRTIIFPKLVATGTASVNYAKGAVQSLEVEYSVLRHSRDSNSTANWVTNGTFTGSATGWSLSTFAYSSNAIGITTASGTATQTVTNLLAGHSYTLIFDLTRSAGSVTPSLGGTNGTTRSATGTYTEAITAGSSNTNLVFTAAAATTATIDNVYLIPNFAVGFVDA